MKQWHEIAIKDIDEKTITYQEKQFLERVREIIKKGEELDLKEDRELINIYKKTNISNK